VIAKTVGALVLIHLALPVNMTVTAAALLRRALRPSPPKPRRDTGTAGRRTVLISGGKMTKALHLARAFHRAGHRVVLVESAKYRFTGHRFSRDVDAFHVVPKPDSPAYAAELLRIVNVEHVNVYVPVCSPLGSYYDALAKPLLEPHCEVLHCDAETVAALDDKHRFVEMAAKLGLSVPDSHRVTAPEQVTEVLETAAEPPYILKSIPYDPVNRLDLTPLPRATPAATTAFARTKPINPATPWIVQQYVRGEEYCVHTTVREGAVQVYACCPSSAFQLNYAMTDLPEIRAWVRGFVEPLRLTGQISFDFIRTGDGRVLPIECNPRTHSAITMFDEYPALARAYLDDGVPLTVPPPASRPTYWLYYELWRLLRSPRTVRERLRTIVRGRDAIFDAEDPLPFLLAHHLHIPLLLLRALIHRRDWVRIDFNIGKLVEPAGD
jgi:hypothetical protein